MESDSPVVVIDGDFSEMDVAVAGEVPASDASAVVAVSSEEMTKFNNNFVTATVFVGIALGIIAGLVLGIALNGIFRD